MPEEGLMYNIGDEEFQYRTKATILLNKPVGYEVRILSRCDRWAVLA